MQIFFYGDFLSRFLIQKNMKKIKGILYLFGYRSMLPMTKRNTEMSEMLATSCNHGLQSLGLRRAKMKHVQDITSPPKRREMAPAPSHFDPVIETFLSCGGNQTKEKYAHSLAQPQNACYVNARSKDKKKSKKYISNHPMHHA